MVWPVISDGNIMTSKRPDLSIMLYSKIRFLNLVFPVKHGMIATRWKGNGLKRNNYYYNIITN